MARDFRNRHHALQNEGAWLHQLEEPGTCGIVEHGAIDLGIARIGANRASKALAVQHVQLHEPLFLADLTGAARMTLPLLPPRKALAVYEVCRANALARGDEPIVRVEAIAALAVERWQLRH